MRNNIKSQSFKVRFSQQLSSSSLTELLTILFHVPFGGNWNVTVKYSFSMNCKLYLVSILHMSGINPRFTELLLSKYVQYFLIKISLVIQC